MATKTYDPSAVFVSVLGNLISGFMDGTMVEVEFDEDAFTKVTGADGETARARNNNKGASMKFTLMQTSASNDILSAIYAADQLTGEGVGPSFVKELNGTTSMLAASSWIKKMTPVTYSKEIEARVWEIDCAALNAFVGGIL